MYLIKHKTLGFFKGMETRQKDGLGPSFLSEDKEIVSAGKILQYNWKEDAERTAEIVRASFANKEMIVIVEV